MATKDITDIQVCEAYKVYREIYTIISVHDDRHKYPYEILHEMTGEPVKVCFSAIDRAERHGYIDFGVSRRLGWLTEKGKALLGLKEEDK